MGAFLQKKYTGKIVLVAIPAVLGDSDDMELGTGCKCCLPLMVFNAPLLVIVPGSLFTKGSESKGSECSLTLVFSFQLQNLLLNLK